MHNTASEPSFPQPSKGGFRRGEYGGVDGGASMSQASTMGGDQNDKPVDIISARSRANKNNVKMDELDRMLEDDSLQLISMKKDIKKSQRQQLIDAQKSLASIRKEYDNLCRSNTLREKELLEVRDKSNGLQNLLSSGMNAQNSLIKKVSKLEGQISKVNDIFDSELRTEKVLKHMKERLAKEIASCRIEIQKRSFTLEQLRSERISSENAIQSSKQEVDDLNRQLITLKSTAEARQQQRIAKINQLQDMLEEGEQSRIKMQESLEEESLAVHSPAKLDISPPRPSSQNGDMNRRGMRKNTDEDVPIEAGIGAGITYDIPLSMTESGNVGGVTGNNNSSSNSKITFEQVLTMAEHVKSAVDRKRKMELTMKDLEAESKLMAENIQQVSDSLAAKRERLNDLSSNRNIYQEIDSKDSTLTTARKDCDEFLAKGQSLKLNIESLKSAVCRLLNKLTKTLYITPSIDNLSDHVIRLEDEMSKAMKAISASLLSDATNEDIAEATERQGNASDNDSELEALLKLPGFQRFENHLFVNIMSAKQDKSGRNIRVVHLGADAAEAKVEEAKRIAAAQRKQRKFDKHANSASSGGANSNHKEGDNKDHHQSQTSLQTLESGSDTAGNESNGGASSGRRMKSIKEPRSLDRDTIKNIATLVVDREKR